MADFGGGEGGFCLHLNRVKKRKNRPREQSIGFSANEGGSEGGLSPLFYNQKIRRCLERRIGLTDVVKF